MSEKDRCENEQLNYLHKFLKGLVMKVHRVHQREIQGSMEQMNEIVKTHGTQKDRLYPYEIWSKMLSKGPEGPPALGRYMSRGDRDLFVVTVFENAADINLVWKFLKPVGFNGVLYLNVKQAGIGKLHFSGGVQMETKGVVALLLWLFVMRPAHDAVVEDLLDKVEMQLGQVPKPRKGWSLWVKFLRRAIGIESGEYMRRHEERLKREAESGKPDLI